MIHALLGQLFPVFLQNVVMASMFAALGVWAFMTLRDSDRTRFESIAARPAIPALVIAATLGGLVITEDSTGPVAALFLACYVLPLFCAFRSASLALLETRRSIDGQTNP